MCQKRRGSTSAEKSLRRAPRRIPGYALIPYSVLFASWLASWSSASRVTTGALTTHPPPRALPTLGVGLLALMPSVGPLAGPVPVNAVDGAPAGVVRPDGHRPRTRPDPVVVAATAVPIHLPTA